MRSKSIALVLLSMFPIVCVAAPPSRAPGSPELNIEVSWGFNSFVNGNFKSLIVLASSSGVGVNTLGATVPFDEFNPISVPTGWSLQIPVNDYASPNAYDPCQFKVHGFTNLGNGTYKFDFHIVCKARIPGINDRIDEWGGSNFAVVSYSGAYVGTALKTIRFL